MSICFWCENILYDKVLPYQNGKEKIAAELSLSMFLKRFVKDAIYERKKNVCWVIATFCSFFGLVEARLFLLNLLVI